MITLFLTTAVAAPVLLLGEGNREVELAAALEAEGHSVTVYTLSDDWDGVTPAATEFDAVIWLEGGSEWFAQTTLQRSADAALVSYVKSGGGLIRTAWAANNEAVGRRGGDLGLDVLLPVVKGSQGTRLGGSATVVASTPAAFHVGLPAAGTSFDLPNTRSESTNMSPFVSQDAFAAAVWDGGFPLVTIDFSGGTMAYINAAAGGASMDPDVVQVFVNTVEFVRATDADSDGFRSSIDCDDDEPAVNPGIDDVCDGIDNDCRDGDETDVDKDGFDGGEGGDDCNDDDQRTYPGAPERWYDGIDQDCAGGDDWDQDGDGYRHPSDGGDDCDDSDPEAHPGGVDVAGSGYDGDCDGLVTTSDGRSVTPEAWRAEQAGAHADAVEEQLKEFASCSSVPSGSSGLTFGSLFSLLLMRRRRCDTL